MVANIDMANNELKARIALKSDTASNWASSAIVLLKGEPAIEIDTGRWKFGDGVNVYSKLSYADISAEEIKKIVTDNAVDTISLAEGDANGKIGLTVDGTTTYIAVKGLGSAAYTNSGAYATSAQGTKADNALPKSGGTMTGGLTLSGAPTTDLQAATKKYVDDKISDGIAAADAMIFKGTLGTSGTITALPTTYKTGWTYRVITAGTYAGNKCEIGDLVIALVDRSGSGNVNADWTVAQTNIDGAVTGADGGITKDGATVKHSNNVTAGTASGSTGNVGFGGTISIPSITYDANGHVTSVDTTTVTLPSNPNSDTKVTNTLNTTSKAYVTGTTSASTNTGTQIFDTGVYLDTTAGQLVATNFKGKLTGNVTGNVSGSSGSCTGNSATASKLASSKNFSITGGATASAVGFDGSGAVELDVTSVNTDYLSNGSNTLILNCGNSAS